MAEIGGVCSERFGAVGAALRDHLDSGEELGASIAVDVDGVLEVDLWGGFADRARTRPWTRDTVVNMWSSTKTVTSLAALMLVDRGALDVHAPVAAYWPEFAAGGKEDIEVRHLLAHTSGLSGWERPFSIEDMYDWPTASARLAAQEPWWKPGTASGYHLQTYGQLIGELVRRVTGRSLKQFVDEEIARPLGADLQIGAREADWPRIAELAPPPAAVLDLEALDPDGPTYKAFLGSPGTAEAAGTPAWRRAELGAVNGHSNARSMARALSAISRGGEVDGHRLLSPSTIDLVFQEQARGDDLSIGIPLRWGIGYALPHPGTLPYIPDDRVCFWGGWGGSLVIMDVSRRTTITYMMNKMAPGVLGSDRAETYVRAIYEALTA
ncbi:EstA family serine hydrolase [Streptomyces varsoviensis]|uniref:Beta-lactamase n=1 Tax=Streptomyces varsoviensis TaxID=67373 RepID=A0ABR5J9U0_9ACTN|nr:EstA family serine hydrolase [Streptomyces varsoviensis]KOG90214.1 beta-lactamase [Streptomyces varsoviensis]